MLRRLRARAAARVSRLGPRGLGLRVQLPDEKGVLDWDDDELLARCGELGHVNLVLTRPRNAT